MIEEIFSEHADVLREFLEVNREKIFETASILRGKILSGHTIFVAGNGGSMSDSIHMVTELMGKFYMERNPIRAISLGVNPSLTTALSNDYSFSNGFEREFKGLAAEGDVLVAISTSGRSKNILKLVKTAREMGCFVISMTGKNGTLMERHSNLTFSVPSGNVPRIQECHIFLIHILCQILEEEIYGN